MRPILSSRLLGRMSEEEFFLFCKEQRDLRIEQSAEGEIFIMPPTGFDTGDLNAEINYQLRHWNKQQKFGKSVDSSTGFRLPNGAKRSPDAAWVAMDRVKALTAEERKRFAPLCPDFVIELRSETDSLLTLDRKMEEYMANGCKLAWLIDPQNEIVYIYRENGTRAEVKGFDQSISGEEVLPGFELDLRELRMVDL